LSYPHYNIIQLKTIGDERGSLISLESNHNIPFDIKRVYYIFNTQSEVKRGNHAHSELQQILICVSGSCKIKLDTGKNVDLISLSRPNQGLLIGKLIWREMFDFSKDCVLMVLADNYYNEQEYIRDYQEFLEKVKNRNE
jgi:dTDP-4-dehydrorhamnose 3,5-epimerase-like enzyme